MRRGGVRWLTFVVAAAGLLASAASIGPASAQTADEVAASAWATAASASAPGLAMADFEGRRIDLSTNWEQAKACLVLRRAGKIECFRTAKEADTKAATLSSQFAAAGYSCSSPLRLFEHSSYGGRQLLFFDRGYWQNLGDYGFNDQLSSYIIGACYTYLAEHSYGGGAFYPGPTYAWAGVSWMISSWNDRVSSIYMA